jgi:hypothetical protein
MQSPVFFTLADEIIYLIHSFIEKAGNLACFAPEYGPVKFIEAADHEQCNNLQHYESDECKIAADKKENVTHKPILNPSQREGLLKVVY